MGQKRLDGTNTQTLTKDRSWLGRFGFSEPTPHQDGAEARTSDSINPTSRSFDSPAEETVSSLSTRARQIMRLDLQGKSKKEISLALDVSVAQITRIRKQPLYASCIQTMAEEVDSLVISRESSLGSSPSNPAMGVVQQETEAAARKVASLMHAEKEEVQLKAAQDLLNRGGVTAPKFTETASGTPGVEITSDEASDIQAGLNYLRSRGQESSSLAI